MRKRFISWLLFTMMTVMAFAGKEELYVLYEGFESGNIPETWTQESSGQQAWFVEKSDVAVYPTGAAVGEYRAMLRNTTGQTQRSVTKLITPAFDISQTVQPVLIFSRAQNQKTGDVDELRIYYRATATDRWVLLKEYTSKQTKWTEETIGLPGATATYQLAFEGTDNFGNGIALDEIIVRPAPTCEDPSNISVDGLTTTSATLRWNGSLDTENFRVVLSTKEITDIAQPEGVVYDQLINDYSVNINDLSQNTKYYMYIQAQCGVEESEWSTFTFTTKNLVNVPYVQNFNKNYASGTITQVSYWTHGTSIKKDDGSMEFMPFINQNTSETAWKNYSFSNTTCLVFTGARNTSTLIPAGEYVYAATPELNVESVKNLQASFWGTCYSNFDEANANGLIVGVMTDPSDWTTFVPVDTVYINGASLFDRFTVYFDSYVGEGKYIAFASNFVDKANIFFMDELEIKLKTGVKMPTDVSLFNATSKAISINANMNGASASKVYITKHVIEAKTGQVQLDPLAESFGAENILATYDVTSFPYTAVLPDNANGMFVQVYVQNVEGQNGSDFALPQKQLVPKHWDGQSEMLINFDNTDVDKNWSSNELKNYWNNSSSYNYPYEMITDFFTEPGLSSSSTVYTVRYPLLGGTTNATKYHSKGGAVYLKRDRRVFGDGTEWIMPHGQYIALPEVDDMSTFFLQFYMTSYSDSHPEASGVIVGAMTDPFDASTFDTIATVTSGNDWSLAIVSFADYKGNGHFPAIMAATMITNDSWSGGSGSGSGTSYKDYYMSGSWIDDVQYLKAGVCMPPSGMKAETGYDQATITWNANGMEQWIVNICKDEKMADTLVSDTVTVASYLAKELVPHTMYYYNIVALCGGQEYPSDNVYFETECLPAEAIPYKEDFEAYASGSTTKIVPACWNVMQQMVKYTGSGESSTSWYPYVGASTYAHTGTKGYYFQYYKMTSSYSITPNMDNKPSFIALPLMAEELNKLQITFWMKAGGTSYVGDTVYVGVMSDPTDLATFDTIQMVQTTSAYSEYIVSFKGYEGKGKYIAFLKTARELARACYLDDIVVDYFSDCEKTQGVQATDLTENGATINWTASDAPQYEVVVADTVVTLGKEVTVGGHIILDKVVTENTLLINQCPKTNTTYYVYVRSLCGEHNIGDWSNGITFKTECGAQSAGAYGFIDIASDKFKNEDFLCWTVGSRKGTTKPSVTVGSHLYIYNSKPTATAPNEGAYAIMPPILVDSMSRLQVKFTASAGTNATNLRELTVGIITNPSDLSTFEAIETVKLPQAVTSISKANHETNLEEAQTYIVRFDKYAGDYEGNYGKQIMFLSENGEVANYIYLYSLEVDTIPTCSEPNAINVVEVNAYDATFIWDSISNAYEAQLLDANKQVLQSKLVDTCKVKFEGLTELTKYYVQARNICAVGDTSAWSPSKGFRTECPPAFALPYAQNFDDYASGAANYPDCWDRFCVGSTTTYPYIYSTAKKDGKNGLYMYRTTSIYTYAVLPPFEGKTSNLMVDFDYRNSSTSYPMEMYVGVATDVTSAAGIDSTFVKLGTVTAVKYAAPNNIWYHYQLQLDQYTGENGRIVFISPKAASSTTNGYAYIDNLEVDKIPTCFKPIDLTFVSATPSTATLSWTPQGEETAWDIAYVPTGGDIKNATIVTVSGNGPKGTVTGLTDGTEYDFYVRANCGEGDVSRWSAMISGETNTLVALADAHWDFDNGATQKYIPGQTTSKQEIGWKVGNYSATTYATNATYMPKMQANAYNTTTKLMTSQYAYSGDTCLYFYGYSTAGMAAMYAALPQVKDAELGDLQISLKGRANYVTKSKVSDKDSVYYYTYSTGSYQRTLSIGVMKDIYDFESVQHIADIEFDEILKDDAGNIVEGNHWKDITVSLYGAEGTNVVLYSKYDKNNIFYLDDVVLEKETGINMPTFVKLDEETFTGNHADLVWKSRAAKFEITVTDMTDTTVVLKDTLNQTSVSLDNLNALTNYSVSIKSMNEQATQSSDPAVFNFKTPCAPYNETNAKWDFSQASAIYEYAGVTTYKIPECWEAGQITKAAAATNTYMPQVKVSTATTYVYGREENDTDGALQFYNYTSTYGDSYAVLPELNVDYNKSALHFWMRAAYFWPEGAALSTNKKKIRETNTNYPKDLWVGTISDMSDMSTFVQQDKVTYPYDLAATVYSYNDETSNDYWVEVLLPLKKYKDQGRIVLYYPLGQKTGYMFIDDVEVIYADFCSPITNVDAKNVTATAADITWSFTDKDSVQLQMATTEDFAEGTIFVDSVLYNANGLFQIATLEPGTDYYVRIKHLCDEEEESAWTMTYNFATLFNVRFNEQFSEVRTYPQYWTRANSKIIDVLDNNVTPNPIAESITANWVRSATLADMTVSTGTGTGSSSSATYYNYWLLSPTITLKDVPAGKDLMLSFDLYLTDNSNAQPFNKPSEFDEFIVVVSTDGGKTFPRANATIWDAQGTQRSYSSITGTPTKQMIDMTQYAGQDIVIAFASNAHCELDIPCSKNYVHLDNVQLNTYKKNVYEESICQYNDYEDENFFVDADNLNIGESTVYSKFAPATKDGNDDILTELTLTANAAVTTENATTVCEGEKVEVYNFVIDAAKQSGAYKQKLQSAAGCDSISVLNVTVLPTLTDKVEATICQGDYYEFNGAKYYTSIVKTDSLKSVATGCDSIVTLYLTVNAILEGLDEADLCPGDSIEFGKFGWIKEAGSYLDTVKTAIGCDSAVTLIVYKREAMATRIQGAIFAGESYSDDVFQGLTAAGDYPSKQQTVYGCDSIVTLHLMVTNGEMLYDTISVEQLPYVINGTELLDASIVAGVYVRQIQIGGKSVDLTIVVGEGTGFAPIYFDQNGKNQKLIYKGRLYILNNGKWTDAAGMSVNGKF
ncbi:MAG: fibronectin type III domain-containing protein [Paludibacteraceae bacterium]|nr:fibronectin type III domain-containing protein [Paludibacteraceae bacterium]